MGLFKKKQTLPGDLPPPPPPARSIPEIPIIDDMDASLPPMPQLPPTPPSPSDELHPMEDGSFGLSGNSSDMGFPDIPRLEELQRDLPPLPPVDETTERIEVPVFEPQPIEQIRMPTPVGQRTVAEEDSPKIIQQGSAFVPIKAYGAVLDDIATIRADMRKADDSLKHLQEIKDASDSLFEKFRSQLEDLQRKSAYVDKSLFKEGISYGQ